MNPLRFSTDTTRRLRWLLVCWAAVSGGAAAQFEAPQEREGRPCAECHEAVSRAFAATRMAEAASGADFLAEWEEKGQPAYCTGCHAPSGGKGLVCEDCHGAGGHPYPKLAVPAACARCHDAPGESTVRRFLAGPAARRGEDCLDCHLPETSSGMDHGFEGPSVPGFLDGVAKVRVFLRREETHGATALVQIRHKAGHALPGGTTGRSVWLVVRGLGADGEQVWRETVRFGWEHHPDRGWVDRTLPPGRPQVLELREPARERAVKLSAELIYRFRPGRLDEPDPRAVVLDALELSLPE